MRGRKSSAGSRWLLLSTAALPLLINRIDTAHAQSGDAAPEEITVTGTRLRKTDGMAEPVPVTTVSPAELQQFEPGSTIAEQLDSLPQFFLTSTAQRGGPALFGNGGGSYLNMRGLGPERTLVLFDGFRMPPADKRGSVNVDALPTALVRSVDVVTGGASAAYGADALGGVTNFILDREYQGLKLSVGTGMNEFQNEGKNWNMSVAGGKRFGDKLNLIASFEARHIDQIWRDPATLDPSWFQRWGQVQNPAWRATDPPGTQPRRLTVPWVAPAGLHVDGKIGGVPTTSALSGMRFNDAGTGLVRFDTGTLTDGSWISGGPDAMIANQTLAGGPTGSEVVQRTAFVGLKYRVAEHVDLFFDILAGHVESNARQFITGATMSGPWSATIFRENAYLPASVRTTMVAENRASFLIAKGASYPGELDIYSNSESRNEFDTRLFRAGFEWTMNDNWDMRVAMQTGSTEKLTGLFDGLRVDRLALAMDAVEIYSDRRDTNGDGLPDLVADVDRGTGRIICNVQRYNPTPAQLAAVPAIQGKTKTTLNGVVPVLSPIGLDNTVSDCVPINVLGHGNVTPAAADYITTPKWGIGVVDQDFAEMLVRGKLTDGWGAGPLSLATGLTYRNQSFHDGAYPIEIDALGPPFNAPNLGIRGIASTWTTGSPNLHQFSTVSTISGGYDVWEAFGEINVPLWKAKSGAQHLGSSFAYRSSDYSSVGRIESWKAGLDFQLLKSLRLRATKSRDVREATFSERFDFSPGGGTVLDPARNQASSTITLTTGGNPALTPETADTTVVGFVYQPNWAEGLRMSFDRYKVDISQSIATLGAQRVVDECYTNGVLCQYVFRDSAGVLSRVISPYLNLNLARAMGTDVEIAYNRDVDWFSRKRDESLSIRLLGGKLDQRSDTVVGGAPAEFAGTRGYPDLTYSITASYHVGSWSVQLQQRYVDDVILNRLWVEGIDVDKNVINSQSWTNFVLGYEGKSRGKGNWRLTLNVQNMFDKNPPIIASALDTRFGAQATDSVYDEFGRRFELGFNMSF